MVYVHTILRDVAGLFKVGRLVAYDGDAVSELMAKRISAAFQSRMGMVHFSLMLRRAG